MTRWKAAALACCLLVPGPGAATTLADAVQKALLRNPEARGARAAVRAAEHQVDQARAGYLPSVDLRLGEGRESTETAALANAGIGERSLERAERSLTLRQNLFDGAATRSEVERTSARLSQAARRVDETSESLALRTADVYLRHLQQETNLEYAEESLARHEALLEMARVRMRSGVGNLADVEQAAARLALARSLLADRQAALRETAARYERLVGERPNGLSLPSPLSAPLPATLEAAREAAVAQHPRVKGGLADLEAARAQRRSARASYLPRVDLELSSSWNRNIDGVLGPQDDRLAMLVLRQNLYRGGGDSARERELVEREYAALAALDEARDAVREQVSIAWENLAAARRSLVQRESHALSSARVLEAYREQFALGRRSLLDLLNSENERLQARSAELETRNAVTLGELRLRALLGTLVADLGLAYPARDADAGVGKMPQGEDDAAR